MNRLQVKYQEVVLPALKKEFNKSNILSLSKPMKVVVNVGVSRKDNTEVEKLLGNIAEQIAVITGQKPKMSAAKKSIAGFKVRQGDIVGVSVTLRGERMWEFLDKLMNIVLPRVKDFQGVGRDHMDKSGNYNLGISEQIVFPEIEYDKVVKVMGLQVTIVTAGHERTESIRMLELLGMPFEKKENNGKNE